MTSNHFAKLFALAALLATGLVASRLSAATFTWQNGTGALDWSDATNWDTNPTLPSSADDTVLEFGTNAAGYTADNDLGTVPFVINQLNLSGTDVFAHAISGFQLQFDGTTPQISQAGDGIFTISNPIELNEALLLAASGGTQDTRVVTLSGDITETGGARAISTSGDGTYTLSGTNGYTGGTTINANSELRAASNSALGTGLVTLTGSNARLIVDDTVTLANAITIEDAGNNKILEVETGDTVTLSGTLTINEENNATGPRFRVIVDDNASLTIDGQITGSGSESGFRMQNGNASSILTLTNNTNDYTGNTHVREGIVRVEADGALGSSTVQLDGSNAQLQLADGVTITNDLDILNRNDNKVLRVESTGSASATHSGEITMSETDNDNFDILALTGDTLTVDGRLTGSVGRIQIGPSTSGGGTVVIGNSTSNYSGAIRFRGGTLVQATEDSAFGTATLQLLDSGTTLELQDTVDIGNALTVTNTNGNKILQVENTGSASATYSGSITMNETTNDNFDVLALAGDTLTLSGQLTGSSGRIQIGPTTSGGGTVVIGNSTSDYDEAIRFRGGTLVQATDDSSFGTASLEMIDTGTTLELTDGIDIGNALNISTTGANKNLRLESGATSATYSGDITITEANNANHFDVTVFTGGTLTMSGNITDSGSGDTGIEKREDGVLVLEGTNAYSGPTRVVDGTVLVNGTNGLGASTSGRVSSYEAESGSTLGGSGTITFDGTFDIRSGGTLAPGAGLGTPGTLTVDMVSSGANSVDLNIGALLLYELGSPGTGDLLQLNNSVGGSDLVLNSNVINFTDVGGMGEGFYTLVSFFSDAGVTPIDHSLTSGLVIGTGLEAFPLSTIEYTTDGRILLNITVPEPATLSLFALAGALVLPWRRRRK